MKITNKKLSSIILASACSLLLSAPILLLGTLVTLHCLELDHGYPQ